MTGFALAVHGGAGTLRRGTMPARQENEYRSALEEALSSGHEVLRRGGTSLDAAIAATVVLEDCPLFNAGRGSVFTHAGTHEMDAAVMEGHSGLVGAIAGVARVRNPVLAARSVMDCSGHVLLSGAGAEAFARDQGLAIEEEGYFHTPLRWAQLLSVRESEQAILDHSETGASSISVNTEKLGGVHGKKFGTVGAVALDQAGNLAAATSTGGLTNKRYGRIGDSPIVGLGTYADTTVAVSTTGTGEAFMRAVAAYDVVARVKYGGVDVTAAARAVIHESVPRYQGYGGLIAIGRDGSIALPFNTEGMYRGLIREDGRPRVDIYEDDAEHARAMGGRP
jgi:L-asparaginase / beta-aspartyl-peptidase